MKILLKIILIVAVLLTVLVMFALYAMNDELEQEMLGYPDDPMLSGLK